MDDSGRLTSIANCNPFKNLAFVIIGKNCKLGRPFFILIPNIENRMPDV